MRSIAVIPARYSSERLPGKPLADILGKPMIQHVVERVRLVPGIDDIIVATDDERIVRAVESFGGKAIITSSRHKSGTERITELVSQFPADIYINIQGDEPLICPNHISKLLEGMRTSNDTLVATLCHSITEFEADNPNSVKVVRDLQNYALYFSRARIPYSRKSKGKVHYLRHIGTYAYRAAALKNYQQIPSSELEDAESLEQLRMLQSGLKILVLQVDEAHPGVDTPACLDRVRSIMNGQNYPSSPEASSNSLTDVKLVITDVDGILTDGSIWYDEHGEHIKKFHVRDGLGIKMLQEVGIKIAVVSGRDSGSLRRRIEDLGISSFALGVKDKAEACMRVMETHQVTAAQTAILGDDSIDLPAFSLCHWPVTVSDAAPYIRSKARITLETAGGNGAFRELSDKILSANGLARMFESADGYREIMGRMAQ